MGVSHVGSLERVRHVPLYDGVGYMRVSLRSRPDRTFPTRNNHRSARLHLRGSNRGKQHHPARYPSLPLAWPHPAVGCGIPYTYAEGNPRWEISNKLIDHEHWYTPNFRSVFAFPAPSP